MITEDTIKQILIQNLGQFEYDRQALHQHKNGQSIQTIVKATLLALVVMALVAIFAILNNYGLNTYLPLCLIAGVAVGMIFAASVKPSATIEEKELKLQQQIKQRVYQRVFSTYNDTLQYRPEESIAEDNFTAAGFYTTFNQFEGEDYGGGQLDDGRYFHFSEVRARQQDNEGTPKLLFDGLLFIVENTYPIEGFQDKFLISSLQNLQKKDATTSQPGRFSKRSNAAKHSLNILDADLALAQEESTPRRLDKRYSIHAPTLPNPEQQLSDEFCKALNSIHLKLSLSFHDGMLYLLVPFKMDFWELNFQESFTYSKSLDNLTQNFYTTFDLLNRLERATEQ